MRQSTRSFAFDPHLICPSDETARRDRLARFAAWFEEAVADELDWDGLRHSKQQAWPLPEQVEATTSGEIKRVH
jgi:hypothetical protein